MICVFIFFYVSLQTRRHYYTMKSGKTNTKNLKYNISLYETKPNKDTSAHSCIGLWTS